MALGTAMMDTKESATLVKLLKCQKTRMLSEANGIAKVAMYDLKRNAR